MSMTPLRNNVALAFDGGGIKGLIVIRALMTLEHELGGGPLIRHPNVKILVGTSTSAIITSCLALGMRARDIAKIYLDMSQAVFPPLAPAWFPKTLERAVEIVRVVFQPYLYSNEMLIEVLKTFIQRQTGKADLTLAELNELLGPDKSLILTAVNITERRTCFLKTYKKSDGDWKLWEAIVASSSAPIALPVWQRTEAGDKQVYYTDGGVGNYGNPAYIAGQEAIVFRGYAPEQVSLLSFGTGWVDADNYEKASGVPAKWHGLDWAQNAPMLLVGDAAELESLDIIEGIGRRKIDFRRFQFALETDASMSPEFDEMDSDFHKMISDFIETNDEISRLIMKIGAWMGERILHDQFAPNADPQYDPEGLYKGQMKYRRAQEIARVSPFNN